MQRPPSQHIEATREIAGGKPRIAGHRITVQDVAIWHEKLGMTADQIATEHGLTLAEIYAALAYYYDNRDEINQTIQSDESFIAELKQQTPSKLKAKLSG